MKHNFKIGDRYKLRGKGNDTLYTVTAVRREEIDQLRDDGYHVTAHLPQINEDGTIEWAFSSGGRFTK
jgi:hypothetical protein